MTEMGYEFFTLLEICKYFWCLNLKLFFCISSVNIFVCAHSYFFEVNITESLFCIIRNQILSVSGDQLSSKGHSELFLKHVFLGGRGV